MLVAITGASGFVGGNIVRRLVERGHRVRALVRNPARFPALASIETVRGHLGDTDSVRALVAGAQAVIHLVGIIVERGSATFTAVHVEGTRRVVTAAREAGCTRFVHMSAQGARDEPGATPYHRTKAKAEEIVRASGVAAVIFRPSFIVGSGNVPIRVLARLHRWLPLVPVFGDARFPMQPVWVEDVAQAFALAAERAELTGTYELGGPDIMTYKEFVQAIGRASRHPRPVVHVPLPLVKLAARAFDLLGPVAPLTTDQLQMLVEGTATPGNAIARVFGITPLPFEEGLKRIFRV